MKKPVIRYRRAGSTLALLAVMSALPLNTAVGQGAFIQIARHQLGNSYSDGYRAYQQEDCIRAIGSFAIYQFLAASVPGEGPRSQQVGQAVNYCWVKLGNALVEKQNLDRYGHITKITIETGGMMDGQGQEVTVGFQRPRLQYVPKVGIPMPQG